jgi:hypothetical protein
VTSHAEHVFAMTHPPYLREKARQLRRENKMSLLDIAEQLHLGKTTVWYWIKDLPNPEIKCRETPARRRSRDAAAKSNRERAHAARSRAYQLGWHEFESLFAVPGFVDFVCLYIGEGYKRSRNCVSIANSDPQVIFLADRWIRRFAVNKVTYAFQYHADQDPDALIQFWARYLDVDQALITGVRKSNSNRLRSRKWRCEWGVLAVTANDTAFRSRLQAWIDRVKQGWLDSADDLGA